MADEAFDIGFIELDDLGNEEHLPGHTGLGDRFLQSFIDDAFMRGVLVNDHQAILSLRHDVSVMNLGACRSERMIDNRAAQWLDRAKSRWSAPAEANRETPQSSPRRRLSPRALPRAPARSSARGRSARAPIRHCESAPRLWPDAR